MVSITWEQVQPKYAIVGGYDIAASATRRSMRSL